MSKEYNREYSRKRNRKRFKAIWKGESDEEGFMTNGHLYTITEVKSSGHYVFENNFGVNDLALASNFEAITRPTLGRRKLYEIE